jgi:hypothetical protein
LEHIKTVYIFPEEITKTKYQALWLENLTKKMNTVAMDSGQTAFILSQLALGAVATFLAIMLWSKTRNIAWMFIIIGVIVAYIEIVHSILGLFGMGGDELFLIGSGPLISFILPSLRMIFFIAAFAVMLSRQYRSK